MKVVSFLLPCHLVEQQFNSIALDRPVVSKVGPGAVEAVEIWGKGASTIIYMAQASQWL